MNSELYLNELLFSKPDLPVLSFVSCQVCDLKSTCYQPHDFSVATVSPIVFSKPHLLMIYGCSSSKADEISNCICLNSSLELLICYFVENTSPELHDFSSTIVLKPCASGIFERSICECCLKSSTLSLAWRLASCSSIWL